MTVAQRLREEREKLALTQEQFGSIGGVKKLAQIHYEKGDRSPDAVYLAAVAQAGADVRYILTGLRDGPPPVVLSADEQTLLRCMREAGPLLRKAALSVLLSGKSSAVGRRVVRRPPSPPAPSAQAAPSAPSAPTDWVTRPAVALQSSTATAL